MFLLFQAMDIDEYVDEVGRGPDIVEDADEDATAPTDADAAFLDAVNNDMEEDVVDEELEVPIIFCKEACSFGNIVVEISSTC